MGVDEPPPRHCPLQLHAQPSNVPVDSPIAWTHLSVPSQAEKLLPRHDPVRSPRELGEQVKLSDREHQRSPSGSRDVLVGEDLEWTYLDHLTTGKRGCRQWLSGGRQCAKDGAPTEVGRRYRAVTRM